MNGSIIELDEFVENIAKLLAIRQGCSPYHMVSYGIIYGFGSQNTFKTRVIKSVLKLIKYY